MPRVSWTLATLTAIAAVTFAAQAAHRPYLETFDHGPGGWYADRHYALSVWDGIAYCHSPWWLDSNHAPPGAGYLHLVMWLYTRKEHYQQDDEYTRKLPYRGSRFAEEEHSTNLTNARLTVRLRGELNLKGAQLLLLVQAKTGKTTANFVLSGQPFRVERQWRDETVVLRPDPRQWICLGARHDMGGVYGCDDIVKVLQDVNLDLIFVLFPVKAVPACPGVKDPHRVRAAQAYPVDSGELPSGLIMFDSVKIEYPD